MVTFAMSTTCRISALKATLLPHNSVLFTAKRAKFCTLRVLV